MAIILFANYNGTTTARDCYRKQKETTTMQQSNSNSSYSKYIVCKHQWQVISTATITTMSQKSSSNNSYGKSKKDINNHSDCNRFPWWIWRKKHNDNAKLEDCQPKAAFVTTRQDNWPATDATRADQLCICIASKFFYILQGKLTSFLSPKQFQSTTTVGLWNVVSVMIPNLVPDSTKAGLRVGWYTLSKWSNLCILFALSWR